MESSLEKFGFPAVSMLRRASASAFAVGKASGLVVDIGASMTSMVPIYDGFVMQKPIIEHQSIGGDLLDTILHEVLKKKRFNVTPFYKDVTVGLSPSFVEKSRMAVVREIKHELCRTSPTPLSGVAGYSNWSMTSTTSTTTSVLPDGTNVDLGPISQVIPELLFDPTPVSVIPNLSSSMSGFDGITTSALECVANCDVDIRKQVSSDIILTGGSSLFPGMPDRLLKSLSSPSTQQSSQRVLVHIPKCKVTATPVSIDRMSSSWLGCSILASCATFQQMWITKDQLAEDGFDRIVNRQLFW
jgi:actin-related protein